MVKRFCIVGIAALLLSVGIGCNREKVDPMPIVNLYEPMSRYRSMTDLERREFVDSDSICIKALLQVYGYNAITDNVLTDWCESPAVRIFTPAVDSVYSSLSQLEQSLGGIIHNASANGLAFPHLRYAAVVWGNRKSMIFVDSVLLIGLNHYLGSDYPGYSAWPEYQRVEKTPEALPYDLAEALIAMSYPYEPGDEPTALSRMLYEGAIIYAKLKLVPQSTLGRALGYSSQQMEWLQANKQSVWRRLVQNKLLYTTSAITIERLVEPAPSTSPIGGEVPGRAGRFIGYSIVCAYLEQKGDVPLSALLSPDFYNNPEVLIESAFSGE